MYIVLHYKNGDNALNALSIYMYISPLVVTLSPTLQ